MKKVCTKVEIQLSYKITFISETYNTKNNIKKLIDRKKKDYACNRFNGTI
jgi:hypothetical protein